MPPLQSAYRKNHSTETALLRVLNDILMTLDHRQHEDVVLVMLDLSAAFDTLDHDILISRLRCFLRHCTQVVLLFTASVVERNRST